MEYLGNGKFALYAMRYTGKEWVGILDALSVEVQATEDTVREMEQFMDFADETAAPLPHGVRVR